MLVIPRGPEHEDLIYVYSGSVVRIRSACYPRNNRDVSAVCTIEESKKWKPIRHSQGGGIQEARDSSGRREASLSRD